MPTDRTENDRRLFGLFREIRGSVRYLQNALEDVLNLASKAAPGDRDAVLKQALDQALFEQVDGMVTGRLKDIRNIFVTDVKEYEWCAGDVATVELTWKTVRDLWPPPKTPFDQAEPALKQIDGDLDQIVYECESLTLSPAINDTMENLRIGQPLDLDFEYGPELPKSDQLKNRLFLELAQESNVIVAGVVDASQRVIYKASSSRAEQRWSVAQIAGAWALFGVVAVAIMALVTGKLDVLPPQWADVRSLLANYVALSVGSGAHWLVEAVKAQRAQTKPSFQAMNDWILWLHVREYEMLWSLVWLALGYVVMSRTITLNLSSAFFAGYSIDSVMEVYLQRFSATVQKKAEAAGQGISSDETGGATEASGLQR